MRVIEIITKEDEVMVKTLSKIVKGVKTGTMDCIAWRNGDLIATDGMRILFLKPTKALATAIGADGYFYPSTDKLLVEIERPSYPNTDRIIENFKCLKQYYTVTINNDTPFDILAPQLIEVARTPLNVKYLEPLKTIEFRLMYVPAVQYDEKKTRNNMIGFKGISGLFFVMPTSSLKRDLYMLTNVDDIREAYNE